MKGFKFATLAVAIVFVLVSTSVAVHFAGDKPLYVFKVLFVSAFGNAENISYTLFFATPLLLSGLAVSIALAAGLFNIGAEGQLYMGAVTCLSWAMATKGWGAHAVLAQWIGGFIAAFAGGALWSGLAGFLKVKRQVHEVIVTIMLNFVAAAFVNWMILYTYKNPDTQASETLWINEAARVGKLWHQTSPALLMALAIAAVIFFILARTWWGYRVRAVGLNERSSSVAGISAPRTAMTAMFLSGGIAGLIGFQEVYFNSYRLLDSFSPGYGFTGIAIALIARGNFLKLLVASILFGALHKGALDLDLETEKITRDLSLVIQGLILVALAILSSERFKRRRS